MATYFLTTDTDDTNLLDSRVRRHAELALVASQAEQDVIDHYTSKSKQVRMTTTDAPTAPLYSYIEGSFFFTVQLYGYAADAADATGYNAERASFAGFCRAMREAIARVISHRLLAIDTERDASVSEFSLAGVGSAKRRMGYNARWPSGWSARLDKLYSAKTPIYVT